MQRTLFRGMVVVFGLALLWLGSSETALASHFSSGEMDIAIDSSNQVTGTLRATWAKNAQDNPVSLTVFAASDTTFTTPLQSGNFAAVVADNTDPSFTITTSAISLNLSARTDGDYVIRFSGCCRPTTTNGGASGYSFTALVSKNGTASSPPKFNGTAAVSVPIGFDFHDELNAYDPDGGAVTYAFITDATAPVNGSPIDYGLVLGSSGALDIPSATTTGFANNSRRSYKVRVTDAAGQFSERDVTTIAKTRAAPPPAINNLANTNVEPGASQLQFTGTSTSGAINVTMSAINVPSWASFGQTTGNPSTGTFTFNPVVGDIGEMATVTVVARDNGNPLFQSAKSVTFTVVPLNNQPTISTVVGQVTANGVPVGPLTVTVNDVETALARLTLTGASNNLALLPDANITFGGSGGTRTVTVAPVTGQTGAATVTLTVSDGVKTAQSQFILTVTAPPTVGAIAHQTTASGVAVGPVAFTVADVDSPVAGLTLAGVSNNLVLLPNANITFGGSGAARTVTLTPAAGESGVATVTVTASDGTATGQTQFTLTVTAPPTAGAIANQSTTTGVAVGPVPFTVADVDSPVAGLTLAGASNNLALLPNANITFGGSGAARTVTLAPAAGQTGVAVVTVTVSDGTATGQTQFTLTVLNAPNTVPTVSAVSNQTTTTGVAVGPLPFTVGDSETPAASLVVGGTSNNQTLLPNANITIGGSDAARTVTVTPAAGRTGTATVTLTAFDSVLTGQSQFTLTVVDAPNTAPTISSLGNPTTLTGNAVGPVAFTVGDAETAPASLTLTGTSGNQTLLPNASIVFGGAGSARTFTLTPAAGQNGTATVNIVVSDGALTAQATLTLTVIAPAAAGSPEPCLPVMAASANQGAGSIQVTNAENCTVGQTVRLNPGGANQEDANISGVGGTGASAVQVRAAGTVVVLHLSSPLTHAHVAGESVVSVASVSPQRVEKEDSPRRLTKTERRQAERTNRLGLEDDRTEGNVLEVNCSEQQIVIANRDGAVTIRLHDESREVCQSVRVGAYVEAEGVKETEQLFDAYILSVSRLR